MSANLKYIFKYIRQLTGYSFAVLITALIALSGCGNNKRNELSTNSLTKSEYLRTLDNQMSLMRQAPKSPETEAREHLGSVFPKTVVANTSQTFFITSDHLRLNLTRAYFALGSCGSVVYDASDLAAGWAQARLDEQITLKSYDEKRNEGWRRMNDAQKALNDALAQINAIKYRMEHTTSGDTLAEAQNNTDMSSAKEKELAARLALQNETSKSNAATTAYNNFVASMNDNNDPMHNSGRVVVRVTVDCTIGNSLGTGGFGLLGPEKGDELTPTQVITNIAIRTDDIFLGQRTDHFWYDDLVGQPGLRIPLGMLNQSSKIITDSYPVISLDSVDGFRKYPCPIIEQRPLTDTFVLVVTCLEPPQPGQYKLRIRLAHSSFSWSDNINLLDRNGTYIPDGDSSPSYFRIGTTQKNRTYYLQYDSTSTSGLLRFLPPTGLVDQVWFFSRVGDATQINDTSHDRGQYFKIKSAIDRRCLAIPHDGGYQTVPCALDSSIDATTNVSIWKIIRLGSIDDNVDNSRGRVNLCIKTAVFGSPASSFCMQALPVNQLVRDGTGDSATFRGVLSSYVAGLFIPRSNDLQQGFDKADVAFDIDSTVDIGAQTPIPAALNAPHKESRSVGSSGEFPRLNPTQLTPSQLAELNINKPIRITGAKMYARYFSGTTHAERCLEWYSGYTTYYLALNDCDSDNIRQKWFIDSSEKLHAAFDTTKCLEWTNTNDNGNPVSLNNCDYVGAHLSPAQIVHFNDAGQITNSDNTQCLNAVQGWWERLSGYSWSNGDSVIGHACSPYAAENQIWKVNSSPSLYIQLGAITSDGAKILSMFSGILGIGSGYSGDEVALYSDNRLLNSHWYVSPRNNGTDQVQLRVGGSYGAYCLTDGGSAEDRLDYSPRTVWCDTADDGVRSDRQFWVLKANPDTTTAQVQLQNVASGHCLRKLSSYLGDSAVMGGCEKADNYFNVIVHPQSLGVNVVPKPSRNKCLSSGEESVLKVSKCDDSTVDILGSTVDYLPNGWLRFVERNQCIAYGNGRANVVPCDDNISQNWKLTSFSTASTSSPYNLDVTEMSYAPMFGETVGLVSRANPHGLLSVNAAEQGMLWVRNSISADSSAAALSQVGWKLLPVDYQMNAFCSVSNRSELYRAAWRSAANYRVNAYFFSLLGLY